MKKRALPFKEALKRAAAADRALARAAKFSRTSRARLMVEAAKRKGAK